MLASPKSIILQPLIQIAESLFWQIHVRLTTHKLFQSRHALLAYNLLREAFFDINQTLVCTVYISEHFSLYETKLSRMINQASYQDHPKPLCQNYRLSVMPEATLVTEDPSTLCTVHLRSCHQAGAIKSHRPGGTFTKTIHSQFNNLSSKKSHTLTGCCL